MKFATFRTIPDIVPPLLIAVAALLIYGRTVGFDFVTTWDDNRYVYENPLISSLSWGNIKAAFTTSILGTYGPLHILSYMFDHLLWGMNPAGYHFHNVILHALNGVLLYRLLGLFDIPRGPAFAAAFIFVSHPVQVEAVAWISQRKTLLAVTFLLLSLISYRCHAMGGGVSRRHYMFSLLFFIAALLSKSLAVVLPLLLLSHDLVYRQEQGMKRSLLQLIPYLAAALLFAGIALFTQTPEAGGGRATYYGGGPLGTFYTMLPVFVSYLKLIVWPMNLSADYPVIIRSVPDGTVLASGIFLLLLFAVVVYLVRRRDHRFFWVSFVIAGLLPVSQIVPLVTLMNDRYLYLPMIGVALLVADGGDRIHTWAASRFSGTALSGWGRTLPLLLLVFSLLSLPLLSFLRAGDWRDGITLWGRDLQKYPRNHIIMTSLGDSYREKGDRERACSLYQQALSLNPRYFIALNNYTNLLLETGNPENARGFAANLTLHYPLYAKGFEMLGLSHELTGELEKSEKAYREALRLEPAMPESLTALAIIRLRQGDLVAARTLLEKAEKLGLTPQLAYSIACFELTAGNREQSAQRIRQAVDLGFDNFAQLQGDQCLQPLLDHPDIRALLSRGSGRAGG